MTPGARIAAAIEVLDTVLAGSPAEQALTTWARRSRFAGSKDRAALRDLVFDALRKADTYHWLGGQSSHGWTGRGLMIGAARFHDWNLGELFSGDGYSAPSLSDDEAVEPETEPNCHNVPAWVYDMMVRDLGADAAGTQALALSERAPITLRVNQARISRDEVQARLQNEGFETRVNPRASQALTLTNKFRGVTNTQTYRDGLFEMQDAASQAVVEALNPETSARVLDYCAGGGGKTLALAARFGGQVTAHDISAARMRDIAPRAERAQANVRIEPQTRNLIPSGYDLVLLDAPCSGSGSWRRAPDAKWRLMPDRLAELNAAQKDVLRCGAALTAPMGQLAYVTCSIFSKENTDQTHWFLREFPEWKLLSDHQWRVDEWGDGFYLAVFSRA